jgi:hypothetical protein
MTSYGQSPKYVGLNPTSKGDDLCVLNDDDVFICCEPQLKREGSQTSWATQGVRRRVSE